MPSYDSSTLCLAHQVKFVMDQYAVLPSYDSSTLCLVHQVKFVMDQYAFI